MAEKQSIPQDLAVWVEARKRFRLSHEQIQMARELGMNPKKLGHLDNHKQEQWKIPLPDFILRCYEKRFARPKPEIVRTIEEIASLRLKKKAQRRTMKEERKRLETQGCKGIDESLKQQPESTDGTA
jgi:hypothetical protein